MKNSCLLIGFALFLTTSSAQQGSFKVKNEKNRDTVSAKQLQLRIPKGDNLIYDFDIAEFPLDTTTYTEPNKEIRIAHHCFYPERMPEFSGNIRKYLSKNLRYPEDCKKERIAGKVVLRFFIDTLGYVKDITVLKSVHPLLYAEAIRLVQNMPPWKPAKQGGKPIAVLYTLPILFKL